MLSRAIQPSFVPRNPLDTFSYDWPSQSLLPSTQWPMQSMSMTPLQSMMNDPFFSNPSALDVFDPFNELDRMMSNNISWLNEPSTLPSRLRSPIVPQKYRITLDCSGYNESSINTEVKGQKLTISAKEGVPSQEGGDYSVREFKRTYDLPNYVDSSKLVSFMTNDGLLVVEFPWKEGGKNLFPSIDQANKKVNLDIDIPENIDPNKINVTCRDHDVIVRADYRVKNEDGSVRSKVHYLRRSTFPENTDLSSLKCELDNNVLKINASLGPHHRKRIPIEMKNA